MLGRCVLGVSLLGVCWLSHEVIHAREVCPRCVLLESVSCLAREVCLCPALLGRCVCAPALLGRCVCVLPC